MNLKDVTIIHIIRHPLSSLNSPIKNWLNYEEEKVFSLKTYIFK